MNKKFMVVALMAALSTAGYASPSINGVVDLRPVVNPSNGNGGVSDSHLKDAIDNINHNFGDISLELVDQIARQEETEALDKEQNGRLDGLEGQMSEALGNIAGVDWENKQQQEQLDKHEEALAGKADKGEINDLHAKVEAVEGENNRVNEEQNGRLDGLEGQMSETLGNIAGIDWENKQQQEQLDKHEEALAGKADKGEINDLHAKVEAVEKENERVNAAQDAEIAKGDRIDKVQNQQIGALQTENVEQNNKIEALDKNKVDKNTYEEDKKAQADKDAAQDAEIAKGDRIDKVQNQQIGNLQSQNIAQDKNIQANKDAIAENKNQIAANKAEQDKVNAEQKENNKQQQEAIEANKGNIAANRVDIDKNRDDITALQQNFDRYEGRLSGLEKKVDHLDDKMNKGLSLMAAMNAVDFQNVQTGEMALGAGVGHYGNAQSVALGVAYAPVEDLTVNAKYSITAGDPDSFAVGAGATYKFKVGR